MQNFQLMLTDAEKTFIKDLIFWAMAQPLDQAAGQKPVLKSTTLEQELGAFVTLKKDGQLRGCIGHVVAQGPLVETLEHLAKAAAFEDPRFSPVTLEELDQLTIEVSIMGPLTLCPDPELIEIGRHGLYIRKSLHAGLLLPQVAVEQGWDRETFLDQTCLKAGLPKGSWRKSRVELWWFEAVIF